MVVMKAGEDRQMLSTQMKFFAKADLNFILTSCCLLLFVVLLQWQRQCANTMTYSIQASS